MPILETPRLILRPFNELDIDPLTELMANPDFMKFSLGVYDREKTQNFLDKLIDWNRRDIPSQFAVTIRPDEAVVGYCGFYHHPPDVIEDVEIGYRLHPRCWNKGIATEAARTVQDHGFRDWRLSRLVSLIHLDNVPSRRVAEKNGMRLEREIVFKGFPTQVFGIDRDRWLARGAAE